MRARIKEELLDVHVVTETVKDGSWEWGWEELLFEITTSVASIGGEDLRIIDPR